LLTGPEALSGIGSHVSGQVSIILAAFCYAFTTIYVRRYARGPALEMAAGSMLVGTIAILLLTISTGYLSNFSAPSATSIAAMLYLGVFPTALATLIYFFLVPRLGASRISQVNFAVPVGGTLIGIFVLGETITASSAVALALIMFAIFLVTDTKKSNRRTAG